MIAIISVHPNTFSIQVLPQFVIALYTNNGCINGGWILISVSPSGLIRVNPHSIVVKFACAVIKNWNVIGIGAFKLTL